MTYLTCKNCKRGVLLAFFQSTPRAVGLTCGKRRMTEKVVAFRALTYCHNPWASTSGGAGWSGQINLIYGLGWVGYMF